MKRIVLVNDCAHVMQDMKPYLEKHFDISSVTRTRSLFSKTLGILGKILFSRGELYHVSYALQDAYIVQKLKGLDVLHVHGSDVRQGLFNRKYRRIVLSNLKKAKVVLYSTPDLERLCTSIRSDAQYFPTPVDIERFTPKKTYNNEPAAVYFHKPYEKEPLELFEDLQKKNIKVSSIDHHVPYEEMHEFLQQYDIFIDQHTHKAHSKICLESMSCGLATIDFLNRRDTTHLMLLAQSPEYLQSLGRINKNYIRLKHNAKERAYELMEIWSSLL